MPKPLQSQWDFAKPSAPAAAPERRVFSVAELTAKVRVAVEKEIGHAWVTGEISNLRAQSSGHVYFTLKDQYAQLACVLFKTDARSIDRSLLQDGRTIIVHGEMTVYENRGQYQLRVLNIELHGEGKLQIAFERLKQKLNAEGLFDPKRKRKIPPWPMRIGLVTSLDGAALHDVLHVIQRRHPSLQIFLAPCRVQGPDASREIALALKTLNEWSTTNPNSPLDLILLTRGGGSLEDLWAFNEETTARAIVASAIPVISAIGHEIDFTICDFAADLRAATPSAAAELITQGACDARDQLAAIRAFLSDTLQTHLTAQRTLLAHHRAALERRRPNRVLHERAQRLDDLRYELTRSVTTRLASARNSLTHIQEKLRPLQLRARLRAEKGNLDRLQKLLRQDFHARLQNLRQRLVGLDGKLRVLGPQQTLNRGFSITTDSKTGALLRSAGQTAKGQTIRTQLAKGIIDSRVN